MKDVLVALPKAHVEVASVASQMAKRLRHEGRDQAALLGHRFDHVTEEDRAVAGRKRVSVVPVLFELTVGVLVIGCVIVPTKRRDVVGDLGHEWQVACERAHVVTGLFEIVERISQFDPAVCRAAQKEILQFGADAQLVTELCGTGNLVLQNRSRAERPRLAFHRHVASEAADVRQPREAREGRYIRHRDHVWAVRRLPDVAGSEAGEAGAAGKQVVEVVRRHELRTRLAMHVNKLSKEKLDPLVGDNLAYRVFV